MEKILLSELSSGEERVFEESVRLYEEASRIEKLLLINHAVPGEDYSFLDLFKLAVENIKAKEMENIANQLNKIEYQLYDKWFWKKEGMIQKIKSIGRE